MAFDFFYDLWERDAIVESKNLSLEVQLINSATGQRVSNHANQLNHRAKKKEQAPSIAPLQPSAFAAFRPWRIGQELIVEDLLSAAKVIALTKKQNVDK